MHDSGMKTSDIRRANLALILKTRFDGNKSALGRAVDRQAGYVAGMLPDSKSARSFGEANARDFEQKLGLPRGWLDQPHDAASSEHANVKPALQPYREAREYPVISWVAAGSWSEACELHQPGIAEEWLASNENAGTSGYWLEINGDSMAPPSGFGFPSGMFILIQPEGFDLVSGKYYIAKLLDTGETTFKQYVRDAGVEYLRPLNPAFRTLEITDNVRIIGRVIDAKLPRSAL